MKYIIYALASAALLVSPVSAQSTDQLPIDELRAVAEAGDPDAQFRMGDLYGGYAGEAGLPYDETQMAYWYERAASNGHVGAQISYASLFLYGRGRPADMTQALYWYERAAEQGDDIGQFNTAVAYELGDGAPRDLSTAYVWYFLAAWTGAGDVAGQQRYDTKRNEIQGQLSAAELAVANDRIAAMQVKLSHLKQ